MPPLTLRAINGNPVVRQELAAIPVSQEGRYAGELILTPFELLFSNQQYETLSLDFMELTPDTLRALDAKAKMIRTEQDLAEVGVDEHMLKTLIDNLLVREAGARGPQFIAQRLAVIRERLIMAKEWRLLTLVFAAANYSATHKLTTPANFAGSADPAALIEAGRDVIQGDTGFTPNFLALGRQARLDLKRNAAIKATYPEQTITDAILADYFEVPEIIRVDTGYKRNGVFIPFADNVALLGYHVTNEAAPLTNDGLGRTAWIPYDGQKFDTRQTPPQGVEELIEAGVATRYRPALTNTDSGYLLANTAAA